MSEALKSIFRNKIMSLTSVITVAACLFIWILTFCVVINLDSMLSGVENDVQATIYVDDALDESGLNRLYALIRSNEHVVNAKYQSKEENLLSWCESTGMDPKMFEGHNPLRRSYVITIDNGANIAGTVEWLKSREMEAAGVASVNHAASIIETVVSFNNIVRIICLVIIAILGTVAVVIITNTIKLTINNRKNEISIMKYIGSTNRFIRWPFIIEGFFLGLAGAIIPSAIFIIFYDKLIGLIAVRAPFLTSIISFQRGQDMFLFMIPSVLVLGSAIGVFASISTIRKYLDV